MFVRDYADMISERIKFYGVQADTVNLSHTVSLADALDAAGSRGLLYAIIVTSQHELHRSVTLTILHGRNPQGKTAGSRTDQGTISKWLVNLQ